MHTLKEPVTVAGVILGKHVKNMSLLLFRLYYMAYTVHLNILKLVILILIPFYVFTLMYNIIV